MTVESTSESTSGIDWASVSVSGDGTIVLGVFEDDGTVADIVLHDSTDVAASSAAALFGCAARRVQRPAPNRSEQSSSEFGTLTVSDTLSFSTPEGPLEASAALDGLAVGIVELLVEAVARPVRAR